jgi:hypothetical protein
LTVETKATRTVSGMTTSAGPALGMRDDGGDSGAGVWGWALAVVDRMSATVSADAQALGIFIL